MKIPRSPSGHTIVHVIPDAWGPFVDIRASYLSLARRRPWVHVISENELEGLWDDARTCYVTWSLLDLAAIERSIHHYYGKNRACKVLHVYAEAMDDEGQRLLPQHFGHWHRFKDLSQDYDGVLCHTPRMVEMLGRVGVPTFVMPVGWDAEAMGAPRWEAPKHRDYVFQGSMVGRREIFLPYLMGAFGVGKQIEDFTGTFGRGLLGVLDTAKASLYLAHSAVESFSTWRLWQTFSTSAALVAEKGDAWPAKPGEHYVELTPITGDNAALFAKDLIRIASQPEMLLEIAHRAHEEIARVFTVDAVEDKFLRPVLEKLIP